MLEKTERSNQEWTNQRKPRGAIKNGQTRENREKQSRMDKPQTLETLDTQHTGRRQKK